MTGNMKPPVAKARLLPELRARVLELRRTHSTADVARQTCLAVGTVKAICSRAGTTRDNTAARAFFALPPLALAWTARKGTPWPFCAARGAGAGIHSFSAPLDCCLLVSANLLIPERQTTGALLRKFRLKETRRAAPQK